MSAERIDFAAVKAEHSKSCWGHYCTALDCYDNEQQKAVTWPCLPYRLAVEAERLAGKVARVEALCDGRDALAREYDALSRIRTRDVRAALADQPEQAQP